MTDILVGTMGLLLCAALLAVMLRSQRPELAMCLGLVAGVLVLLTLLGQLLPLLEDLRRLVQSASIPSAYVSTVVKAAGICLLAQLTADTCRDAGETALAGKAELVGRVLLLVLSVPLFADVLAVATDLLGVSG